MGAKLVPSWMFQAVIESLKGQYSEVMIEGM